MMTRSFRYHVLDCDRDVTLERISKLENCLKVQQKHLDIKLPKYCVRSISERKFKIENQMHDALKLLENIEKKLVHLKNKIDEVPMQNTGRSWSDLTVEARSILKLTENFHTGHRQILIIKKGFFYSKFGLHIFVTDFLFEEIIQYICSTNDFAYTLHSHILKIVCTKKQTLRQLKFDRIRDSIRQSY